MSSYRVSKKSKASPRSKRTYHGGKLCLAMPGTTIFQVFVFIQGVRGAATQPQCAMSPPMICNEILVLFGLNAHWASFEGPLEWVLISQIQCLTLIRNVLNKKYVDYRGQGP